MSASSPRRRGRLTGWALLAGVLLPLVLSSAARAATVLLINNDGPGEGFNDPRPVEPVGGNTGTTLGEQRLIAFQSAIDVWAAHLDSTVEIRIAATFDPLDCNSSLVTLGQAGPVSLFRDFTGAPQPNTFYPSALADRLAGMDLAPDEADIEATFNSRFGNGCTFPAGWYYGLDGNVPGDDSDLVTVVLHELGHGMGFLTVVDVNTGARLSDDQGPHNDIFMTFLVDDRTGKTFSQMTNAERRAATTATGHLKWEGADVVAANGRLTSGADGSGRVEMYAPPDATEGSSLSHWSDVLVPHELMQPFFTQPIHDIGLAAEALDDIGWNLPVAQCEGDCNGDGQVSIDELITAVRIALGELPLTACPAIDPDGSGTVGVNELVAAVNRALNGCP